METVQFAGFWRQLWSASLDFAFVMATFVIAVIFMMAVSQEQTALDILSNISGSSTSIFFLYYFLYRTLFIASSLKATLFMKAVKIEVVDDRYERITFLHAVLRELLSYISFFCFGIGYFMLYFTKNKQTFHDLVAKTFVLAK